MSIQDEASSIVDIVLCIDYDGDHLYSLLDHEFYISKLHQNGQSGFPFR